MGAVGPFLRHFAQGPPSFIHQVRPLYHCAVVRTDFLHVTLTAIDVLQEQVAQVLSEAFIDVHLLGPVAGHQVPEPMVCELVGHGGFIVQRAIGDRSRVMDARTVFHGADRGEHIADLFPSIGSEERLEMRERIGQVGEGGAHIGRVGGVRDQFYWDLATEDRGQGVPCHGVVRSGHGYQVSRHGTSTAPVIDQGIAAERDAIHEHPVAPGLFASCCPDEELIDASFREIVKAWEPSTAVGVGYALEGNAQVIQEGWGSVEAAEAARVQHGISTVMNDELNGVLRADR